MGKGNRIGKFGIRHGREHTGTGTNQGDIKLVTWWISARIVGLNLNGSWKTAPVKGLSPKLNRHLHVLFISQASLQKAPQ